MAAQELKHAALDFEPNTAWDALLGDAARHSVRYLKGIRARRVAPDPAALAVLNALGGPLPEGPAEAGRVLELLDGVGSPATVANAGGRYFGFVNGGALPAAVAASWLAVAWDQNAGMRVMSPVAAKVEDIVLEWLVDLLGLPPETSGAFVTGATMANFSGLAAARREVLLREGWDVEARGLSGGPPITVVVGEEVHPTVLKALGLLGLGRERVVVVPADNQGRMRADALPPLRGPVIVCIQAGNVNTGAFDPAEVVCEVAHASGAWVHVDGAFGLWAAADPARSHLLAGFEAADSWATDGHKWLNVPYDSGVALVRRPDRLREAMTITAPYLPHGTEREPMHFTPESSRRARAVEIWAALRTLGRRGVAELIDRTCRHAIRFADALRSSGYEVLNEVVLNQVLVSFGSEDATRRIVAAIQEDGTCWCGGTVWQHRAAMRISVSSWATTEEDVEASLEAILRIARREAGDLA